MPLPFLSEVAQCASLEALQSTRRKGKQKGNWRLGVRKLGGISHMPGWMLTHSILFGFHNNIIKFYLYYVYKELSFGEVKKRFQGHSVGRWCATAIQPQILATLSRFMPLSYTDLHADLGLDYHLHLSQKKTESLRCWVISLTLHSVRCRDLTGPHPKYHR